MKLQFFTLLLGLFCFSAYGQKMSDGYVQQIAQYREEYKEGFLHNERSPLKAADIDKLRFFEADVKYRVKCRFERTPYEKPFDLPTSSGKSKQFVKYGVLHFELEGKQLQLAVYQNLTLKNAGQHLFLPFRDETNGDSTYGGGRYIDLSVADVEAKNPVLDFNKCYNPWCSYSDGYSCPIPPVENTLKIEVPAGEKLWAGEKKH
jgi:uncharacterized protein (DUF1684 family)